MQTVPLGSIVKISKGRKVDSLINSYIPGSKRYIQIEDLRNDNNLKYTNNDGVLVDKENVIIAWDGANAGTIGFGLEGIIGSTLAKLQIIDKRITSNYLGIFLQTKSKFLRQHSTGATIPHISRNVLDGIEIPIIPIEEQNAIVNKIDLISITEKKRKESFILLDDYISSLFLEMFGRKSTNYNEWNTVKLEELAKDGKSSMRTGPFGSDLLHSEFVDTGIAVVGIDNAVQNKFLWGKRRFITKEKYEKLKRYTLYPRDVIVTIMGTNGKSAVIPDDIPLAINSKHLAAITLNQEVANPYFISYSLHSNPDIVHQLKVNSKGAIMAGLNLSIIKKLFIKLPPIELQNQFSEILLNVENLKQKMLNQSLELEKHFQSLLASSFN